MEKDGMEKVKNIIVDIYHLKEVIQKEKNMEKSGNIMEKIH